MHVESVAWVTERKDVLSVALGMLALLLYARYVEHPNPRRYLWVALAFALSLTAKPMLVTFPMVLLLLDFWPLRRIAWPLSWPSLKQPLLEKVPLLVLAGISIMLTFMAQRAHPVVSNLTSFTSFTLPARLANACISYALYLWKTFVPTGLGVLYPSEPPDPGAALWATLLLLAITVAAFRTIRQRPYLAVGWLWYLGTMVPVSGLVMQANADRFTYFPLVGFSIALVWIIADLAASRPVLRQAAGVLAGAALLLLAVAAHAQAAYWRDSLTLFQHTIDVTKRNYIVLNNLGVALTAEGRHDEAMADYRQALSIDPDYADAHANVGHELLREGKLEEARGALVEALRLKPDLPLAQGDLGIVLVATGNFEEARQHLEESLRLAPADADSQSNLCLVLDRLGRLDEALSHCAEALRLKPDMVDAHFNRGTVLAAQGKNVEAAAEFQRVLAAKPDYTAAREALENLHAPAEPRH